MKFRRPDAFDIVRELGCSLPNVEATTKYDGSPVLKIHGVFMAGLAMNASAEPDTLVVRVDFEEREGLLEEAPETYYVTDHYRRYPVVLVRLPLVNRDVLRELLAGSWRMTTAKCRKSRAAPTDTPSGMV
ncbi:MAG: MmcQ/YjbR family DNA-binding protein [Bryobacteraceae bacterium]